MKINFPAEDKITVELTKQDMTELDITYEAMDYSTIETRRVIWTLLDRAGKALGKELDPNGRMVIEAIPVNEGGCVLNFTILGSKKKTGSQRQLLKKQSEYLVCDFDSLDALYLAVSGIASEPESCLYEKNGKYRLTVSGAYDAADIRQYFSEFATVYGCDALLIEHTKEHWRTLIPQNAVSVLSV